FHRDHARRHLPDREGAFVGDLARLQHDVGLRHAAAREDETGGFLFRAERLALVQAVDHEPFELLALARSTGAILAAIGHADALADRRGKNRFAGIDAERAAAGLHGDLERSCWALSARHVCEYPRLLSLERIADFALKPVPPRRAAGALSPRTRADRRLRRRGLARRACAERAGAAAGADLVRPQDDAAALARDHTTRG